MLFQSFKYYLLFVFENSTSVDLPKSFEIVGVDCMLWLKEIWKIVWHDPSSQNSAKYFWIKKIKKFEKLKNL